MNLATGLIAGSPPFTLRPHRGLILLVAVLLLAVLFLPSNASAATVLKVGQDTLIDEGTTVRNAVAIGGQITVKGKVERNVVAIGGSVVLGKSAEVGGNVVAIGGVIVRGSGAKVAGSTTEINLSDITGMLTTAVNEDWEGWSWLFAIVSLFFFLCILALALIAVVFLPRQLRRIAGAIVENPWRASVWGIGGLVLIVPLAALLTISVVGIILIPLELTLAVCASLMGFVAVAHLIGRVALSAKKRAEEKLLREALWGLVILWLIGWIPYLGWLVKVCAVVLGLGGTLMTRFGTDQPPVAPAAPLPGEAPSAAAGPGTEEPQVAH